MHRSPEVHFKKIIGFFLIYILKNDHMQNKKKSQKLPSRCLFRDWITCSNLWAVSACIIIGNYRTGPVMHIELGFEGELMTPQSRTTVDSEVFIRLLSSVTASLCRAVIQPNTPELTSKIMTSVDLFSVLQMAVCFLRHTTHFRRTLSVSPFLHHGP